MAGLTDIFNSDYNAEKINDFVIGVSYTNHSGLTTAYTYDYIARIMTARTSSSDGGAVVVPFSQLDAEGLETLRQELVRQGGKPPALTAPESNTKPALSRPLNP